MKTLIAAATVALVATTFAGPGEGMGPGRGPMGHGPQGGFKGPQDPIVKMVTCPKVAEKIALTDEQKAKIKEVVASSKETQKTLRKQLREAMEKQTELLEGEKIDEAAVMAEIDKAFEARKAMAKAQTKRVIAIKSILTPEQIEKALEEAKNAPKGEMPVMGKRPMGEGPKGECGPKCEGPKCECGPKCGDEPPCPPED